ncbi:MAG: FAD-dependent oxidoreductase [Bdellovibrionales bacterium]|nr:FAD-dependent oxidoreductase [Bdellovibrionales bacterium]
MARSRLFQKIKKLIVEASDPREPSIPSRRDFVHRGLIAASAANLAPQKLFHRATTERVLILGAGAAGLAAAYTLKRKNIPFSLIEATGRPGGRIQTQYNFNHDQQFCELGGELIDASHKTTFALCAELGLKIEHLAAANVGYASTLYHFKGQTYTDQELFKGIRNFVKDLSKTADKVWGDSELPLIYKNKDKLPKFAQVCDKMPLSEFLEKHSPNTEAWIKNLITVAYTGEFGLDTDLQSSLNLINLMDTNIKNGFQMFGPSDEGYRIQGGSESIVRALFSKIEDHFLSDDSILLNTHLRKLTYDGSHFHCYSQSENGTTKSQKFSRVICTIPFSVLRQIDGVMSLPLSPVKKKAIEQLGYGTNTKVMMGFQSRFWRAENSLAEKSTGSLYTENPIQTLWETSRLQPGQSGILTNFIGGRAGYDLVDLSYAQQMGYVEKNIEILKQVYGPSADCFDGALAVKNWGRTPTAQGSYSCPLVGHYFTIQGSAAEVELKGRLQFAGEHTEDDNQSYIEGAFASGIRAARRIK